MFQPGIDGLTPEAEAALQREGLPYWMFWLLLCVILLLMAFIFLRNKELRQRISLSLYSPRRRWNRITLQARLMRENKKKTALLQTLGRTAFRLDADSWGQAELVKKLSELESKLEVERAELRHVSAELVSLQPVPDESRQGGPGQVAAETSKSIRKNLKRILSEIATLERRQDPLLEELGVGVLARRPGQEVFLPLYAQLDLVDESIAEITTAIDTLKRR